LSAVVVRRPHCRRSGAVVGRSVRSDYGAVDCRLIYARKVLLRPSSTHGPNHDRKIRPDVCSFARRSLLHFTSCRASTLGSRSRRCPSFGGVKAKSADECRAARRRSASGAVDGVLSRPASAPCVQLALSIRRLSCSEPVFTSCSMDPPRERQGMITSAEGVRLVPFVLQCPVCSVSRSLSRARVICWPRDCCGGQCIRCATTAKLGVLRSAL
jgi:hypothetical protein